MHLSPDFQLFLKHHGTPLVNGLVRQVLMCQGSVQYARAHWGADADMVPAHGEGSSNSSHKCVIADGDEDSSHSGCCQSMGSGPHLVWGPVGLHPCTLFTLRSLLATYQHQSPAL